MSIVPKPGTAHVPCPPRLPIDYLQIESIKAGPPQKYVCLSTSVYGQIVHFHLGCNRSVSCTIATGRCVWHEFGLPLRWYGFVAVINAANRPRMIQITDRSYQWSPTLGQLDGNLRGRRLLISRLGKANNSPMRVLVTGDHPSTPPIGEPDVPRSVQLLLGQAEQFVIEQLPAEIPAEKPQHSKKGRAKRGAGTS
jgi:hypothetical protein